MWHYRMWYTFFKYSKKRVMMKSSRIPLIVVVIVIIGVILIWIHTIDDGNRILNANNHNEEPTPYYSKENRDKAP